MFHELKNKDFRLIVPSDATLYDVIAALRMCGYILKYKNGFVLIPIAEFERQ